MLKIRPWPRALSAPSTKGKHRHVGPAPVRVHLFPGNDSDARWADEVHAHGRVPEGFAVEPTGGVRLEHDTVPVLELRGEFREEVDPRWEPRSLLDSPILVHADDSAPTLRFVQANVPLITSVAIDLGSSNQHLVSRRRAHAPSHQGGHLLAGSQPKKSLDPLGEGVASMPVIVKGVFIASSQRLATLAAPCCVRLLRIQMTSPPGGGSFARTLGLREKPMLKFK